MGSRIKSGMTWDFRSDSGRALTGGFPLSIDTINQAPILSQSSASEMEKQHIRDNSSASYQQRLLMAAYFDCCLDISRQHPSSQDNRDKRHNFRRHWYLVLLALPIRKKAKIATGIKNECQLCTRGVWILNARLWSFPTTSLRHPGSKPQGDEIF